MSDRKGPDPKDRVQLLNVTKRGDWYSIKGVADGRHVEAHIPAPTLEARERRDGEALMRRTLLGTKMQEHGES